ncbi:hypothetical protein JCGZ_05349 [Jatropha curcas]|uniref:Uncharacterized protein n=1 Tax=Jatropha curcas TaxID=180498 RepID=A0A067L089_JATCU|nr:hypothetical protein JCGZ_05349 [Jatropha curcas]
MAKIRFSEPEPSVPNWWEPELVRTGTRTDPNHFGSSSTSFGTVNRRFQFQSEPMVLVSSEIGQNRPKPARIGQKPAGEPAGTIDFRIIKESKPKPKPFGFKP